MFKTNIKNKVALLLALSMLSVGVLSAVETTKVYANADCTPSVTAYADKATLAGDTFTPKYDTDGSFIGTVGKLKFGQNANYNVQEWYILGSDSGVNGGENNTAIFAADNITNRLAFQSSYYYDSTEEKNLNGNRTISGAEVTYEGSPSPTKFCANHYGLSDARNTLKDMAKDSSYFTPKEQALMNETKVETEDMLNTVEGTPRSYSTSDKLYLPNYDASSKIKIGSDDSIKLDYSNYWGTGEWFWLRTPYSDIIKGNFEFTAYRSGLFDKELVDNDYYTSLRPASNLNLSDILFASAASVSTNDTQPETGTDVVAHDITDDAMSLRLDGGDEIDKSIGTVFYSSRDNTVTAIKGNTDKDVSLIIQYKVDGTDKYISERITGTYITKLDIDSGYNVSQCKIWLEIPVDDDSTLAYAVEATEHDHTLGDKPEKFDEQWHGYKCIDEECPVPGGYFENLEEHIWGDDNLCDICDYRKGDHIPYKVNETQPTRTNVGYREHFECRHCDKWFVYPATLGVLDEKPKSYFEIPYTGKKTSSSGSSSNINNGWIKDSKGWRFRNSDGTLAQGTTVTDADGNKVEKVLWQKAGNGYFAFGFDSYLITGWIYDRLEDKWYYCDENLGKLYGWFKEAQDGYWYYLSPSTGEALTGWQNINGKNYYFAGMPSVPTYSFDAETDTWVYSNTNGVRPFGAMYANTVTPDNYQVDANGAWIH